MTSLYYMLLVVTHSAHAHADAGVSDEDGAAMPARQATWRVARRFSQFVELHDELRSRHAAALRQSGAHLPNKFRLPSALEVEGSQRAPELDAYLQKLVANNELRQSEQLVYFLAANTPNRRRLWQAAITAGGESYARTTHSAGL